MKVSAAGFERVFQYADMFKEGMLCTVYLSLFTVILGFLLALVLAVMRMSNFRPFGFLSLDREGHLRDGGVLLALSRFNPLNFIATVYVEVVRATPMLVQLFIVYQVVFSKDVINLPSVTVLGFLKLNRFLPGVVALALNSGAYLSEIIRAGIQSIDGGQTEAARSLGLAQGQSMRFIVLPQAIKNILPAIGNEFVTIIKESAITYTIGVQDLMSAVKAAQAGTFLVLEPLLVVAVMYFCLTFPTSKVIAYFERRMRRGDKR
ncbi:amino acid ABC transporter permease [uncultured Oscillibacter sp.]|uniref:amino acid ABC transporter permease n=1 Tax=uncultured Oscillibacter sp. TaxID=876091 RepID=UPI0028037700|nr:amino acid ABC transporter permease [uncultured Oscillibacter sp.]